MKLGKELIHDPQQPYGEARMKRLSDRQKVFAKMEKLTGIKTIKKKQRSMKAIKSELWSLCKQIIRQRYGNTCYTCSADRLKGSNWHTGHFIPSSTCGAFLRYDLRNLRPQCYNCNINAGGNGAIFSKRMHEREGAYYVQAIIDDIERVTDARLRYEAQIEEYRLMLGLELSKKKE